MNPEIKETSLDRIIVECQPGLAIYVAYDLIGRYGHFGIQVLYHENTVEVISDYIPLEVETWLKHNEAVVSLQRHDVLMLEMEAMDALSNILPMYDETSADIPGGYGIASQGVL